jgi:hypothetical protein
MVSENHDYKNARCICVQLWSSTQRLFPPIWCDSERIHLHCILFCKETQWNKGIGKGSSSMGLCLLRDISPEPCSNHSLTPDPAVCQSTSVYKSTRCWGRTPNNLGYEDWSEGCARKPFSNPFFESCSSCNRLSFRCSKTHKTLSSF